MGAFSRGNVIEYARFDKQCGKCALCGKRLVRANYNRGHRGAWNAHHIDGNPRNSVMSNCAAVCINPPENCHLNVAHDGHFRLGALAPHWMFRLERRPDRYIPKRPRRR